MFGYIRPLKGELKVSEYEKYASVFCGLCGTLQKRYGFFARFMINYDFTFLVMILCGDDTELQCDHKRCPASPFKKKCSRTAGRAGELAADYCVILYYWKLRDALSDEGFFKRLYIRPFLLLYRRKYKRAAALREDFDSSVRINLSLLSELERDGEKSLDAAADKFAKILESAENADASEKTRLVTSKLLYHIGRIIYILDAYDDLEEDLKKERYNPLAKRFTLENNKLRKEDTELLKATLERSAEIAAADFELLPAGAFSDILANILYMGIPRTIEEIINKGAEKL